MGHLSGFGTADRQDNNMSARDKLVQNLSVTNYCECRYFRMYTFSWI